jgi:hypothetical protein
MTRNRPKTNRRPWWRYFLQFSLRTLMIVTTLAAIACWWFLQPQTRDEQLAGGLLKLRRQVRFRPRDKAAMPMRRGRHKLDGPHGLVQMVNAGRWQLRNQRDDLLVAGRFENDRPEGRWITYHTNGRKAAEGGLLHGAKHGPWRVWNEEGQLLSEVNFVATEPARRMMGGLRGGWQPESPAAAAARTWESRRQGPWRVWHANGRLKAEGSYQNDLRDGLWTTYDEDGRLAAQDRYRGDNRQ